MLLYLLEVDYTFYISISHASGLITGTKQKKIWLWPFKHWNAFNKKSKGELSTSRGYYPTTIQCHGKTHTNQPNKKKPKLHSLWTTAFNCLHSGTKHQMCNIWWREIVLDQFTLIILTFCSRWWGKVETVVLDVWSYQVVVYCQPKVAVDYSYPSRTAKHKCTCRYWMWKDAAELEKSSLELTGGIELLLSLNTLATMYVDITMIDRVWNEWL